MLRPDYTSKFKKDLKKISKSGKDIEIIREVIKKLVNEIPLKVKYKDHNLKGNYKDHRECHIENDWLLIYRIECHEIIFVRTGSHSELFRR